MVSYGEKGSKGKWDRRSRQRSQDLNPWLKGNSDALSEGSTINFSFLLGCSHEEWWQARNFPRRKLQRSRKQITKTTIFHFSPTGRFELLWWNWLLTSGVIMELWFFSILQCCGEFMAGAMRFQPEINRLTPCGLFKGPLSVNTNWC